MMDIDNRGGSKVSVKNLHHKVDAEKLKSVFKDAGEVVNLEVFFDTDAVLKGLKRKNAVIEFAYPIEAAQAISMFHHQILFDRRVTVSLDRVPERSEKIKLPEGLKEGIGKGLGPNGKPLKNVRFILPAVADNPYSRFNTYGMSVQFLKNLDIHGPLHEKVLVTNLAYKVDKDKLIEIFKLAGKVVRLKVFPDNYANSRGRKGKHAVIEFDHPVEAVQAISMLDRQTIFHRRVSVRLLGTLVKNEDQKMLEGLKCISKGLGPNEEPLEKVRFNSTSQLQKQPVPVPAQAQVSAPARVEPSQQQHTQSFTQGIGLRSSTNKDFALNVNLGDATLSKGAATSTAAQPGGQGTQDYSAEWANYYRSLGKIGEAEAIEKLIGTSKGGQGGAPAQPEGGYPGAHNMAADQYTHQYSGGYQGQQQYQSAYGGFSGGLQNSGKNLTKDQEGKLSDWRTEYRYLV